MDDSIKGMAFINTNKGNETVGYKNAGQRKSRQDLFFAVALKPNAQFLSWSF